MSQARRTTRRLSFVADTRGVARSIYGWSGTQSG